MNVNRRDLLRTGSIGGVALLGGYLLPDFASAQSAPETFVERTLGRKAAISARVRLIMPAKFPSGYTVPMTVEIDSPMTAADHVRQVQVFAPQNPIVEIAAFVFVPERSLARVTTRVRLAKPQHVVAVAEMSDGALLMNTAWVHVDTNGCV